MASRCKRLVLAGAALVAAYPQAAAQHQCGFEPPRTYGIQPILIVPWTSILAPGATALFAPAKCAGFVHEAVHGRTYSYTWAWNHVSLAESQESQPAHVRVQAWTAVPAGRRRPLRRGRVPVVAGRRRSGVLGPRRQ